MSALSRRGIMAASAAIAAPVAALATPASPDAALIAACARYLALETVMNDPARDGLFRACSDMPEWAEYVEMEDALEAAVPQTLAGMAALARVALHSADAEWDESTSQRVAGKVLARLCGGAGPHAARA